jgi:hypothetical protein
MATPQPVMSPSATPVTAVLDHASGPRRQEADELVALFGEISGERPVVWAERIIGFGEYEYRYDTGHSGRAPRLAFATGPRQHTLYLEADFAERWPDLLAELGPHRASKVCLYLTRMTGVNRSALRSLLERTFAETRAAN